MTASSPQQPGATYDNHLFETGLSTAFQLTVPEVREIFFLRYGNEYPGNSNVLETENGSTLKNQRPQTQATSSLHHAADAGGVSAKVNNAKVAIFEAWQERAARVTANTFSAENTAAPEARVMDANESESGHTPAGSSAAAAARVAQFRAMLSGAIPTGTSVSVRGNVSEETANARA